MEKCYEVYAKVRDMKDTSMLFRNTKSVTHGKRPDSGFPNFLRAAEVGSKIKREKGPASSRRPGVRCRAVPDPVLGMFQKIIPVLRTIPANLDRRQ